jgi:thioredoxin-like negative regulator of GroEL
MSLLGINLIILVLMSAAFWWLSGFDTHLSGTNRGRRFARRVLRCGVSLAVVEFCILSFSQYAKHPHSAAGYLYPVLAMPLAVIWSGCLSQMGMQFFKSLMGPEDPDDSGGFQLDRDVRMLDQIAKFIRQGKKEQAIQLCKKLKASGDVSPAVLDMTLTHLGEAPEPLRLVRPLAEAHRLKLAGKFGHAESILKSLLAKNPRDLDAAMPLMRLYAQDLHRADKAWKVLKMLESQPHIAAAHLDFARRSIDEWSKPQVQLPVTAEPPGSVDELLEQGCVGTAMELLEVQMEAEPENFDLRLRLAELHVFYAGNVQAAERIIAQVEAKLNPEQMQLAQAKLREWQRQN